MEKLQNKPQLTVLLLSQGVFVERSHLIRKSDKIYCAISV